MALKEQMTNEPQSTPDAPENTRFPNVYCSQCGRDFGPGDHGFSHCQDHAATMLPKPTDAEIVRSVFPDAYTYCQGEDSLYMVHSHKFGGWMTTGHYARSDAWKAARAKLASSVGQQPAVPVEQMEAGMEQDGEQVLPARPKVRSDEHYNLVFDAEPADAYMDVLETIGIEQLAEIQRLTAELSRGREENIKLLNDASIWRNRAIGAEEELREGGRGIDLRRGFER